MQPLCAYQVSNAVQSVRNCARVSGDGITNLARRMLEVVEQIFVIYTIVNIYSDFTVSIICQ